MNRVNEEMLARGNKHAAVLRTREEQFTRCMAGQCEMLLARTSACAARAAAVLFLAFFFILRMCCRNELFIRSDKV